jgi:hypothetical protein
MPQTGGRSVQHAGKTQDSAHAAPIEGQPIDALNPALSRGAGEWELLPAGRARRADSYGRTELSATLAGALRATCSAISSRFQA